MIHLNRKQSMTALVVAVALVLVAVGGYMWLHNKHAASTDPVAQNAALPGAEGGKYLVIPEWGVRFPLDEGLRGDVYTNISSARASGTVLFASKKLNSMTGDNSCDFVRQPWGGYTGGVQARLVRVNPEAYERSLLEEYKSQLTFVKKLGQYEYYSVKSAKNPPVTCLTGVHDELADTEQTITNNLVDAFSKIDVVR